ncbi:MAG: copper chaperone PCu(A)C [Burkholderiales bacterium]
MSSLRLFGIAVVFLLTACSSQDDEVPIRIADPWVRATVAGQTTAAGYVEFHSKKPMRLIKVTSPQAGAVRIHRAVHQNDVMRMEELAALEIPANETITLAPSGLHFMLTNLKSPLAAGDEATLSFTFELADKSTLQVNALAEVRAP